MTQGDGGGVSFECTIYGDSELIYLNAGYA